MVRLRVLFGAMLGTGLIGLGLGIELGQREKAPGHADATASMSPPPCSVTVPPCAPSIPNIDNSFHTIRVPEFKNRIRGNHLAKGCERELTNAVVRAIEMRTAYKAVEAGEADTELTGEIVSFSQSCLNYNQINTIQETETILDVEVSWRDLRTGKSLLTQNGKERPSTSPLKSVAHYRPEINESIEQARKMNVERMADAIIFLMEKSN